MGGRPAGASGRLSPRPLPIPHPDSCTSPTPFPFLTDSGRGRSIWGVEHFPTARPAPALPTCRGRPSRGSDSGEGRTGRGSGRGARLLRSRALQRRRVDSRARRLGAGSARTAGWGPPPLPPSGTRPICFLEAPGAIASHPAPPTIRLHSCSQPSSWDDLTHPCGQPGLRQGPAGLPHLPVPFATPLHQVKVGLSTSPSGTQ